MIYETLTCFAEELNEFFRAKLKITEDKVVVSSIVNQDGSVAIQGENKLVVTLIYLGKEPVGKPVSLSSGGKPFSTNTPSALALSLQIMCSAYFTNNYMEGLKFLTMLISFLQQKPVFTLSNTPSLHPDIEKLIFDMDTIGFERQTNVWAMIGAKYMPSVLYKIRMIVFDTGIGSEYRPLTQGVKEDTNIVN